MSASISSCEKFGVEAPRLISDLSPKVSDVMESRVVSVRGTTTAYDALQLMEQKQLRGLPVADGAGKCLGLLSAFKLSHHLFPPREEAGTARLVTASLSDIVSTLSGRVMSGAVDHEPREYMLMVGAMARASVAPRLQRAAGKRVIFFVGDRPRIQELALDRRHLRGRASPAGFRSSRRSSARPSRPACRSSRRRTIPPPACCSPAAPCA